MLDRQIAGLNLMTIGDLLSRPQEETRWVVQDRLPQGGLSLLSSKPKVGKSTLARSLALSVATGEPWLGWPVSQGGVIYLALEEKESEIARHFVQMGAKGDEDLALVCGPLIERPYEKLRHDVAERAPALVVIDTFQHFSRVKDPNNYAEVVLAIGQLLDIARESGAHIMVVHHDRKGYRSVDGDEVLGSIGFKATVDTIIHLHRSKNHRTIWTEQRYGPQLEETIINFNESTRTPTRGIHSDDFEANRLGREIETVLCGAPEPLTEDELDKLVTGRTGTKRAALRRLHQAGAIARSGTGKKGSPYRYSMPLPSPHEGPVVSCSPVPIRGEGQETSTNQEGAPDGTRDAGSRSQTRVPAIERGNEKVHPDGDGHESTRK